MHSPPISLAATALLISSAFATAPLPPAAPEVPVRLSAEGTQAVSKTIQKVHHVSNIWLTTSNFGFFGDPGETFPDHYESTDGIDGHISCQFPARSGHDYLFQGGIWIGAIVGDDTLVSVGTDGWAFPDASKEFFAGGDAADSIQVRSTRNSSIHFDEEAISEEDFVATYTDTLLTSDFSAVSINHRSPLNILIEERSYAWSFSYAEDLVIFDYVIKNNGLKTLQDVYMGVYLDGDVGPTPRSQSDGFGNAQDDITGFRPFDSAGKVINTAWLADFDGPEYRNAVTGDGMLLPGVMALRVVRTPAKQLRTTYNWWFSDDDVEVDWGPGRRFPDGLRGTPDGDVNKYLIMRGWQNETLPDSLADPITGIRRDPSQLDANKDGSVIGADDTRFLLSFGPFTVPPDDVLPVTLGYFCAENFFRGGDPDQFDFTDLDINARWVQFVFDNPSVDTPTDDFGADGMEGTGDPGEGDGVLDTGDFFFGEDVGVDGVPGTGDYGESNGRLDTLQVGGLTKSEDTALRWVIHAIEPDPTNPEESALDYLRSVAGDIDWSATAAVIMSELPRLRLSSVTRFGLENGFMDEGDGLPDFSGPPPPPAPELKIEKRNDHSITIKWSASAEDFVDSFIPERRRQRDFQGYRIYSSRTGAGADFTALKDFDLAEVPDRDEDGVPLLDPLGDVLMLPDTVGRNTGFAAIENPDADSSSYDYSWTLEPVIPSWPLFIAVTAYDNGYPPARLGSLESSVFANAVEVTPSTPLGEDLPVLVVPNPYKINAEYSESGWELPPEQWTEFDRRIDFTNLNGPGTIRVFTLAGDLVQTIPHQEQESRASWDLISRNGQAIVSGIYLFAVTYDDDSKTDVGKFVVLK